MKTEIHKPILRFSESNSVKINPSVRERWNFKPFSKQFLAFVRKLLTEQSGQLKEGAKVSRKLLKKYLKMQLSIDPDYLVKFPGFSTDNSFIVIGGKIVCLAGKDRADKSQALGAGACGKVKAGLIIDDPDQAIVAIKIGKSDTVVDTLTKIYPKLGCAYTVRKPLSAKPSAPAREPKSTTVNNKPLHGDAIVSKGYLMSPLYAGTDLSVYLKRHEKQGKAISYMQTLKIALAISVKIKELHDKGWIHADIKPANIMIKVDSNQDVIINIIDFGFAFELDAGQESKHFDCVFGTPRYIAPEARQTRVMYVEHENPKRQETKSDSIKSEATKNEPAKVEADNVEVVREVYHKCITKFHGDFGYASDVYALGVTFIRKLALLTHPDTQGKLSKQHKKHMNTIWKMTKHFPEARPDMENVINALQNLISVEREAKASSDFRPR